MSRGLEGHAGVWEQNRHTTSVTLSNYTANHKLITNISALQHVCVCVVPTVCGVVGLVAWGQRVLLVFPGRSLVLDGGAHVAVGGQGAAGAQWPSSWEEEEDTVSICLAFL